MEKRPKNRTKHGIAGVTLLAFLLTQLARPIPASAWDTLRAEATAENKSGLEERLKGARSSPRELQSYGANSPKIKAPSNIPLAISKVTSAGLEERDSRKILSALETGTAQERIDATLSLQKKLETDPQSRSDPLMERIAQAVVQNLSFRETLKSYLRSREGKRFLIASALWISMVAFPIGIFAKMVGFLFVLWNFPWGFILDQVRTIVSEHLLRPMRSNQFLVRLNSASLGGTLAHFHIAPQILAAAVYLHLRDFQSGKPLSDTDELFLDSVSVGDGIKSLIPLMEDGGSLLRDFAEEVPAQVALLTSPEVKTRLHASTYLLHAVLSNTGQISQQLAQEIPSLVEILAHDEAAIEARSFLKIMIEDRDRAYQEALDAQIPSLENFMEHGSDKTKQTVYEVLNEMAEAGQSHHPGRIKQILLRWKPWKDREEMRSLIEEIMSEEPGSLMEEVLLEALEELDADVAAELRRIKSSPKTAGLEEQFDPKIAVAIRDALFGWKDPAKAQGLLLEQPDTLVPGYIRDIQEEWERQSQKIKAGRLDQQDAGVERGEAFDLLKKGTLIEDFLLLVERWEGAQFDEARDVATSFRVALAMRIEEIEGLLKGYFDTWGFSEADFQKLRDRVPLDDQLELNPGQAFLAEIRSDPNLEEVIQQALERHTFEPLYQWALTREHRNRLESEATLEAEIFGGPRREATEGNEDMPQSILAAILLQKERGYPEAAQQLIDLMIAWVDPNQSLREVPAAYDARGESGRWARPEAAVVQAVYQVWTQDIGFPIKSIAEVFSPRGEFLSGFMNRRSQEYTGWIPDITREKFSASAEAVKLEDEFDTLAFTLSHEFKVGTEALFGLRVDAHNRTESDLTHLVGQFVSTRLPSQLEQQEYKERLHSLLLRDRTLSKPMGTGLEEHQAIRSHMQESLEALGERAPSGITPFVIGPLFQEMDSRSRFLAGLEEQGIYLYDGKDKVSFIARIIVQHPEARFLRFVGLEEETRELLPLASRAGMTIQVAWPTHGLLSIISQMTGLEEAFLKTQADFQEFQAGLEALSSGA